MKLYFNDITLDILSNGKRFTLTLEDKTVQAEVLRSDREAPPHAGNGKLDFLINGERVTAYVSFDSAKRWVTVNGQTLVLVKSSSRRRGGYGHHHAAGMLRVTAPMPGQIRALNVGEGDTVMKGQTLLVLEAMKMEIRVHSPRNGVVKKLFVQQGQTVEREQILVDIEEI